MKKAILFTGFLILIFLSNCHCQIMLKGSLNIPYFHGGDKTFSGYKHNAPGIAYGFAWRAKLGTAVHLHTELFYSANGAKNPQEENRVFKPSYITLPVMLSIGGGPLTVEVGGYFSYLWKAENYDFYGNGLGGNFSWRTRGGNWNYYKETDRGLVFGATYNAQPILFGAHMRYGLIDVRKRSYNDAKMLGNRTTAFDASIYLPWKFWKH